MECLINTIGYLSKSEVRLEILDVIDSEPLDLRDLMDITGSPRTTLQRNLSLLIERGWIDESPTGYTTTTTGSFLLREAKKTNKVVEKIHEIRPLIELIPSSSEINIRRLNNFNVIVPDCSSPYRPANHLRESINASEYIRGVVSFMPKIIVDRFFDLSPESFDNEEFILTERAYSSLMEKTTSTPKWVSNSNYPDIRIFENDFPYSLFILDEKILLAACDNIGRLEVLVEADCEESLNWAENIYSTHRLESSLPNI
ncbi:hypothetical protein [Haladaptatus sp. R4]|uniref:transcriptional regulator FilR1 domain-containing protein n=1 Tax=Haladaptatus sp. R4 TaxID=1679489 RepID=UPI000AAE46C1|nr:hypothetical protein [Haladaptatus sp. R4]